MGYSQADSALYQLSQIANDTERVNRIYQAGFALRNTDPELAYLYAQTAETEALKTASKKHLAKSYNLKGILHYKKGDYTQALSFQQKALQLNEAAKFAYGSAINHTNLGNIYSDMGYDELAEAAYLKALKVYNGLNNRGQIVNSLINLGVLKNKEKHYSTTIRYFQTALAMATEDHDMAVMATCNNNIGAVLVEQNLPDSALLYLEESWKLLNLQDNEMEMTDVYLNMAMSYLKKNEAAKAFRYLTLADSLCSVYDYTDAKVEVYGSYALFYEKQQDYQKANDWLKKHYRLKDSILQLSKEAMSISLVEESPALSENIPKPTFKNGWILVILGALVVGIPLFLIRYKR
jgi:tetratricopeptide (TPR) repeat protein